MIAAQIPLATRQQHNIGIMAHRKSLCQEKQKSESIPEGHDHSKPCGEHANRIHLCMVIELPQDGINERGYGQFRADHETDTNGCDDIQCKHLAIHS